MAQRRRRGGGPMTAVRMPVSRRRPQGLRRCIRQDGLQMSDCKLQQHRDAVLRFSAKHAHTDSHLNDLVSGGTGVTTGDSVRLSVGVDRRLQLATRNRGARVRTRTAATPRPHTPMVPAARVCVFTLRTSGRASRRKHKSHDGAGLPPRGRGRRPRRSRARTTTTGTLEEYCSSTARQSSAKVPQSGGGLP